ncbi:MAG: hypothetical protein ACOY41_03130 [Pseudomonadota bacterium]
MPVRPLPYPRALPSLPAPSRVPTPTLVVRPETWLEDSIPTREILEARAPHYLARGRRGRADLRLVNVQDIAWVVKDFSRQRGWLRRTLGSWLIAREVAALKRLQGLEGIPQGVVRVDRLAFAYRHVEGVPLASMLSEHLSSDFFNRFEALAEAMHRRGIVHLDLRQGSNVLVTADQQPVILDFHAHLRLPRRLAGLVRLLARLDLNAIHHLWNRYLLTVLSAELKPARRTRS